MFQDVSTKNSVDEHPKVKIHFEGGPHSRVYLQFQYYFYSPQETFASLPLIYLYFKLQIPVEPQKIIGLSSNIQILFFLHITLASVKE